MNTTTNTASENTTNVISQEVNSTSGEIKNIVDVPDDPVAVGKKHASKKYEQFVLNTSCFCTICVIFHNFGLIFAGQWSEKTISKNVYFSL